MRLTVSGTANIGKTTLINDFLKEWPNYKTPTYSYRDLIKAKNAKHSKETTKELQWAILNSMMDEMQKYTKDDNIIFDRSPWDCLVYTLWSCEMKVSDIDEEFVRQMIPLVKESMKLTDIMFFLPKSEMSPIDIVEDGFRDTDPIFIEEIDNIFKALHYQYRQFFGKNPFFPSEDCPAIIEIYGNREQRIQLLRQYLDVDGKIIGEDGDTILNPNNVSELEELIKQQSTSFRIESESKDKEDQEDEDVSKNSNRINYKNSKGAKHRGRVDWNH